MHRLFSFWSKEIRLCRLCPCPKPRLHCLPALREKAPPRHTRTHRSWRAVGWNCPCVPGRIMCTSRNQSESVGICRNPSESVGITNRKSWKSWKSWNSCSMFRTFAKIFEVGINSAKGEKSNSWIVQLWRSGMFRLLVCLKEFKCATWTQCHDDVLHLLGNLGLALGVPPMWPGRHSIWVDTECWIE